MICPNCNVEIPDGIKFCTSCGHKLPVETTPPRAGDESGPADTSDLTDTSSWLETHAPINKGISRRAFIIGGAAAAGVVATIGVGNALGKSTGLASKKIVTVDDYSWEEISDLANQIASAPSDAAGLEIAKKYHLCNCDGSLDGAGVKTLQLSYGPSAQVQIIGFRHDVSAADYGLAGISFAFTSPVAAAVMSDSTMWSGGWDQSPLRACLNGAFLSALPDDLVSCLTPVIKLTNNAGATRSASSVTATEDAVWLPSMKEMGGDYDVSSFSPCYTYLADIYSAEGEQYQLWREQGVRPIGGNSTLCMDWDGQGCYWWSRTSSPDCSQSNGETWFNRVGPDGNVFKYACPATGDCNCTAVVPAFCL